MNPEQSAACTYYSKTSRCRVQGWPRKNWIDGVKPHTEKKNKTATQAPHLAQDKCLKLHEMLMT